MYPIPIEALDDRLGFVGTSGSGKTYGAGTAVEKLLARRSRVVIPDPLGVWWGLRLDADGMRPSKFEIVIFGGAHGDIAINEHAGAIIGETVAGMKESAIVDLSGLGTKAAERRFMLAFLTALYRRSSTEPLHVVFDEADLWAPQQIRDRAQEPAKLLGMMENIVRRGRVKGFIPWLITQRPAVVNKDVLSQVDGLIAFKLTASQDRKALGDWIEGQADRQEGKEILASLPALDLGQAVTWLPGRGVLATERFPEKVTFDSSRTPKRGEKVSTAALKPLDLGALREKLAKVEDEVKANDPTALKLRIADLTKQLAARRQEVDPAVIAAAEDRGEERGYRRGVEDGTAKGRFAGIAVGIARAQAALADLRADDEENGIPVTIHAAAPVPARVRLQPSPPRPEPATVPKPAPTPIDGVTGPQQTLLNALAWWERAGNVSPSRAMVAAVCGWNVTSGHLKNVAGSLKTAGLVDYPTAGALSLTAAGRAIASAPEGSLQDMLGRLLSGPQKSVFDVLASGPMDRAGVADALGWNASSGHLKNVAGSLKTLDIVTYPSAGVLERTAWTFQ